jgi:hypothetical protein
MPHRVCETGSPDQASLDALLRSGNECISHGYLKLFAKVALQMEESAYVIYETSAQLLAWEVCLMQEHILATRGKCTYIHPYLNPGIRPQPSWGLPLVGRIEYCSLLL